MIHTTRQSMKFKMLVRKLRPFVTDCIVDAESVAVAILERLWHATAVGAPEGDIGRFDDDIIAEECGWMKDAKDLIGVLVETGYLDTCDQYRLLVHDWKEHSPKWVKGVVAKKGGFAKSIKTAPTPKNSDTENDVEAEVDSTGGSSPTLEDVRKYFKKTNLNNICPDNFYWYWKGVDWCDIHHRQINWEAKANQQNINPPRHLLAGAVIDKKKPPSPYKSFD